MNLKLFLVVLITGMLVFSFALPSLAQEEEITPTTTEAVPEETPEVSPEETPEVTPEEAPEATPSRVSASDIDVSEGGVSDTSLITATVDGDIFEIQYNPVDASATIQYRPTPGFIAADMISTMNRIFEYEDVNENGVFDEDVDTIVQSFVLAELTPTSVVSQEVSEIPEVALIVSPEETPVETPEATEAVTPEETPEEAMTPEAEVTEEAQVEETPEATPEETPAETPEEAATPEETPAAVEGVPGQMITVSYEVDGGTIDMSLLMLPEQASTDNLTVNPTDGFMRIAIFDFPWQQNNTSLAVDITVDSTVADTLVIQEENGMRIIAEGSDDSFAFLQPSATALVDGATEETQVNIYSPAGLMPTATPEEAAEETPEENVTEEAVTPEAEVTEEAQVEETPEESPAAEETPEEAVTPEEAPEETPVVIDQVSMFISVSQGESIVFESVQGIGFGEVEEGGPEIAGVTPVFEVGETPEEMEETPVEGVPGAQTSPQTPGFLAVSAVVGLGAALLVARRR